MKKEIKCLSQRNCGEIVKPQEEIKCGCEKEKRRKEDITKVKKKAKNKDEHKKQQTW